MENEIVWGNVTFQDMVNNKPYNWTVINPPIINHYWFESQDPHSLIGWMADHFNLAYYVGFIYIVTIFALKAWMKNRPAYDLRRPLFYWNGALAVFSITAFVRMAPSLLYTLTKPQGLYKTVCVKEGIDIPTAFWTYMFTWSKIIELGDTLFIVLRKRPLVFLQYYHHLATMIVTWTTTPFVEPGARYFCVMNSAVHAIMYPYFTLSAAGVKIPRFFANVITTVQFVQMIVGLGVNVVSWYLYEYGYDCDRHPFSIQTWGALYVSFVFLFGKLFYDKVVVGNKHKKKE